MSLDIRTPEELDKYWFDKIQAGDVTFQQYTALMSTYRLEAQHIGFDQAMAQCATIWVAEFNNRGLPLSANLILQAVTEYRRRREGKAL